MTIQELEYFKIICQERSITKAAKLLYITPQGLSKTIKNIEYELNTTLFNRYSSGITLTESGEYLYSQLPVLLDDYYSLYKGIQAITQRQNHEIDLLSAYGILRLVTTECILDFKEKYPHIKFHYREYPDKQVERLFSSKEGNVALTIGASAFRDLSNFSCTHLESFEIKLLVNKHHPLSQKKTVAIYDLEHEPLYIESSEFQIYHLILDKCREAGFSPNIVFETSGFSLCHKVVKKNKGISVTVDFIFDDMHDEDIVSIPFSDGEYQWSTYMVTREEDRTNPDLLLFHNHIMEWMDAIKSGHIRR